MLRVGIASPDNFGQFSLDSDDTKELFKFHLDFKLELLK